MSKEEGQPAGYHLTLLVAILTRNPDAVGVGELGRLAGLPDPRLRSSSKADVDCQPVRDLSLRELQRRGA